MKTANVGTRVHRTTPMAGPTPSHIPLVMWCGTVAHPANLSEEEMAALPQCEECVELHKALVWKQIDEAHAALDELS